MKSFKEYLTESKKVYEFKIKIAGDCPKDCATKIKTALSTYKVESCSSGKSTPIAENHADFPNVKNVGVTIYDVTLSYPATSLQIRSAVADKLSISSDNVRVRNLAEEAEQEINHQHDNPTGKAVLGTDYESSDNQSLVGEQYVMNFLKGLTQEKRTGHAVEGANPALFPKTGKEKTQTEQSAKEQKSRSPVAKRPEDVVKKVY